MMVFLGFVVIVAIGTFISFKIYENYKSNHSINKELKETKKTKEEVEKMKEHNDKVLSKYDGISKYECGCELDEIRKFLKEAGISYIDEVYYRYFGMNRESYYGEDVICVEKGLGEPVRRAIKSWIKQEKIKREDEIIEKTKEILKKVGIDEIEIEDAETKE